MIQATPMKASGFYYFRYDIPAPPLVENLVEQIKAIARRQHSGPSTTAQGSDARRFHAGYACALAEALDAMPPTSHRNASHRWPRDE